MWQIILTVAIVFLLIEIFAPAMFFLNFAFAAFICSIVSLFCNNIPILITIFCILSLIFIFTLRPLLMKNINSKNLKTGIEEKYIGKTAKAIEDIDKNKGAITIYDERWQARNLDDDIIKKDEIVEIIGYESLTMTVKRKND